MENSKNSRVLDEKNFYYKSVIRLIYDKTAEVRHFIGCGIDGVPRLRLLVTDLRYGGRVRLQVRPHGVCGEPHDTWTGFFSNYHTTNGPYSFTHLSPTLNIFINRRRPSIAHVDTVRRLNNETCFTRTGLS